MAYALWDRSFKVQIRVIPFGPTVTASFSRPDMDVRSCMRCFMSRVSTCQEKSGEGSANGEAVRPSHPEYGKTAGVGANTGPLGQEFANAVGMKAGKDLRSDISEGTNNGAEQRSVSGRKLNQRLGKVVPQTQNRNRLPSLEVRESVR